MRPLVKVLEGMGDVLANRNHDPTDGRQSTPVPFEARMPPAIAEPFAIGLAAGPVGPLERTGDRHGAGKSA